MWSLMNRETRTAVSDRETSGMPKNLPSSEEADGCCASFPFDGALACANPPEVGRNLALPPFAADANILATAMSALLLIAPSSFVRFSDPAVRFAIYPICPGHARGDYEYYALVNRSLRKDYNFNASSKIEIRL